MSTRLIRGVLACAIFLPIALPQAVTNPSNPTNNPNQINVTNGYLYLNKLHYAGTYSSAVSYSTQDLVISASLPYISLVQANLNNTPVSSPTQWFPLPAGAAVSAWGTITGTLSSQTDLNTALGLALAKASNLSDLANAGTARTNLGLATVAASGSASDLGSGTLPHARLPTLLTGDIPNNAANTSGLAGTATALAANGANCSAGSYPLGVDASGASESCTALPTFPILSKTANYQVLAADFSNSTTIVVPSGSPTITLVASGSQPSAGKYIWVVNYGSGTVSVAVSGQNINGGGGSISLLAGNSLSTTSALVWSDGTNYFAKADSGAVLQAQSAANLQGVTTNSIPYQSGVVTTSYMPVVNSAVLCTSAGGVPSECTTLPAVSAANLTSFPTLNQSTSGNAATATALAANGANCSAGSYPLGVDASGASESCTALPTFPSGTVVGTSDTQTLTNKHIAGSEVDSGTLPHAQLPSLVSGDIPNNAANTSGLAATATALAASPTNCTTGQFPSGVNASGTAQNCRDGRDVHIIPFAASPAATAATGITYASGWTATNRAGSNNIGAALQAIPSTGGTLYFEIELPADWDAGSQPYIRLQYGSGANTSGTVIWTLSSACTKSDGSVTDDPAYNAESAFATQTMATANRSWAQTGQFTAITSGNNCIAGSPIIFKAVLSGTAGSLINAYQAVVTIPTLTNPGQAE